MTGARADEPLARRSSTAFAAAYTYGTNLLVAVLSLANVIIVARTLGPTGRGDVAFLTAIATFVSALATMGIEESNANLAASRPELRRRLASNSIVFALLFGILAALSVSVLWELVPAAAGESSDALRRLTLASLGFTVLGIYLRYFIRADYGFAITNVTWFLMAFVNVTVNGLFAVLGILSVATAVSAWVAGQVLSTLVLVWWVVRRMEGFGWPSASLMWRTLVFGVKTHVGRVMLLGNYRLDQWILGAVSSARELGLYSVAVAWAEALWFLPTALALVQRTDLVKAKREQAARLTATWFRAATAITGVLIVAMLVAAPLLCVTVFGEEFRGSINELRVLTFGAFGVVSLKLFGNALVAQGRPLLSSAALSTGFVFTVALDVLLIPPYAGMGAAVASTVAYTAAGAIMTAFFLVALESRGRDIVPRPSDVTRLRRAARGFRMTRAGVARMRSHRPPLDE